MKILVTGAKGFVGRNLVCNLRNIMEGKNRTRSSLKIEAVLEYDVDTDPSLCRQEREAVLQRLGTGNWKIFGAHGLCKEYRVHI